MCVYGFYPIPNSQQHIKKGSCRHPILFGLLFHFNICWTLGPFVSRFEFGPRTYSVMCFIYLSSFESFYSSLGPFVLSVVPCFCCFYYFCLSCFIMCSYYVLLRFSIICFYYVVIYVSVAFLLFYFVFCYILLLQHLFIVCCNYILYTFSLYLLIMFIKL